MIPYLDLTDPHWGRFYNEPIDPHAVSAEGPGTNNGGLAHPYEDTTAKTIGEYLKSHEYGPSVNLHDLSEMPGGPGSYNGGLCKPKEAPGKTLEDVLKELE
jgi:hypothetical protein